MFTTVRQYRCDESEVDEIARQVDLKFADKLAALDGFDGYEVVDCGDGMVMTITVFEDRETAERSTELAASFIRDELPDTSLERVGSFTGEVRVNRGASRMTELVHA